MNFSQTFPLCFLLNLSSRVDRRIRSEIEFEQHGLKVERLPAINARMIEDSRGFNAPGRYAHALSCCLGIREARRRGAPAVFFFEDDVVLAPELLEALDRVELPPDWGLFYLGAQHKERPEVMVPGLVKVRFALDTHAWGVRAEHYRAVINALMGWRDGSGVKVRRKKGAATRPAADVTLGLLHDDIPTYATYPNLAWQKEDSSDLLGGIYSNYEDSGFQKPNVAQLIGLTAEALGARSYEPVTKPLRFQKTPFRSWGGKDWSEAHSGSSGDDMNPPENLGPRGKTAFLFLTRQEHHLPGIWQEYWDQAGDEVTVYGHAADRTALRSGWLASAQIKAHVPTRWGDVSLVRAQIELLRAALGNRENEFFHFVSESCVPLRPWGDFSLSLDLDPRSRFRHETLEHLQKHHLDKAKRTTVGPRIRKSEWVFHSQWVTLNREAATLVAEDDLTAHFEAMFAPDECYFGTVLSMKGYPIAEKIAPRDTTWAKWKMGQAHPFGYESVSREQASELFSSGQFFGRKFSSVSNIGSFGFHRARNLPLALV